jgi:hypothetical protein
MAIYQTPIHSQNVINYFFITRYFMMQGDVFWCNSHQHHMCMRGAFSTCAKCATHTLYKCIPNTHTHTQFMCAGQPVSPCHSVTLLLNCASTPAVACNAVSQHVAHTLHSPEGQAETATVETEGRAASRGHSLISFQDGCGRFESVVPQKLHCVVILSLFYPHIT